MKDIRELYSKDLNFIPQRITNRKRRHRQNGILLLVLIMITSATCAISHGQQKLADEYRIKIEAIDREITVLEKAAPLYNQLEQAKQEYRSKQEALSRIEEENYSFIEIFDRISSALPTGVYLSSLNYQVKDNMELSVVTRNPVDVARVVVALRDTGLFDEVTLQDKDIPMIPIGEPIVFNLDFAGARGADEENGRQLNPNEGDN